MTRGGDHAAEGPRASFVLLGTLAAGVVVAAVIGGFMMWRDAGEPTAVEGPPTTEPTATTGPGEEGPARLFTRTTGDGIEIRVDSMMAAGGDVVWGGISDGAPDFCEVVDQVNAFAIDERSVVQGALPITKAPPPELAPIAMWSGAVAPDALVGVLLQVPEDVAMARLSVPGAVDEMEPIDGVAALAVESALFAADQDARASAPENTGGPDFRQPDFRQMVVTVLHDDGRTERATGDDLFAGPPVWIGDATCFEDVDRPVDTFAPEDDPFQVHLPPPGAEQPPDPAAAQAQIEAAFDQLYGPADPAVDVLSLVDDPFAMREMFDLARRNDQWDQLDFDSVVVAVEGIVFLSPAEAALDYSLTTPQTTFDELFGRAKLVDGTWRVTRGTICRDLRERGRRLPTVTPQ